MIHHDYYCPHDKTSIMRWDRHKPHLACPVNIDIAIKKIILFDSFCLSCHVLSWLIILSYLVLWAYFGWLSRCSPEVLSCRMIPRLPHVAVVQACRPCRHCSRRWMRWPSDGAWSTVIPCLPSTNQAPGPQGLRVSGCRCWDMRTEEKTLVTQAILKRIGMGQGQKETHF